MLANGDFLFPSFVLHLLIRIFCEGELSFSPHAFLYSIIYLPVWTHEYFSYSVCYTPLLSFYWSHSPSLSHWSSIRLTPISIQWAFTIFWALPFFLESRDVPGPSCVFPAPTIESAVSPRSLGSFIRECNLETNIWD